MTTLNAQATDVTTDRHWLSTDAMASTETNKIIMQLKIVIQFQLDHN